MGKVNLLFCADLCRNHGGDLSTAMRMSHAACSAGADIIKLQQDDGLDGAGHIRLMEEVHGLGKKTALTVRTGNNGWLPEADYLKIGSGECLNEELIKSVKRDGRPWIISTGACTQVQFDRIISEAGDNAIVCECTSSYPNNADEIRLGFLKTTIGDNRRVGYSDHMPSYHMSLAAIALGAIYIEKHISLHPSLPGANHSSSIGTADFTAMVEHGHEIHAALDNTKKTVLPRELSTGKLAEYRGRYEHQ